MKRLTKKQIRQQKHHKPKDRKITVLIDNIPVEVYKCNKRKLTHDEAIEGLEYIKKVSRYLPGKMEKRYYWCCQCEAYHLTKQEFKR